MISEGLLTAPPIARPRQVGKSSTIREFGKSFRYFAEVNFEKTPSLKQLFSENIDIAKLCEKLGATLSVPILPGKTLLFFNEIQSSPEALRSLGYMTPVEYRLSKQAA